MTIVIDENQVIEFTAPSGLLIKASSVCNNVLEDFYRDYDTAFVLANEKEGLEGFRECLQLNTGAAYQKLVQRYGIFRELVLVAYDPGSGTRVGGANFITFPLETGSAVDEPVLSINLNYIFTNPTMRKRGYFSQLVRDIPELAFRLLVTTNRYEVPLSWRSDDFHADARRPQTLMFLEQNDPLRMSAEDYRLDTEFTGLDQLKRIGIWTRLGAKIIDFPYVQPPLTSAQKADPNLVLAVIGTQADTLSPCLLHAHLERFFGISVLKGQDAANNSSATEQLKALRASCAERGALNLFGNLSAIASIDAGGGARPASLRDALRTGATSTAQNR